MCLYPRLILNKKYLPNKKNNYNPPECKDERLKYVPIGCGNCIECRKQNARQWQVRLSEELKNNDNAKFVTLTFNSNELDKLIKETKNIECNATAKLAVRRFLERYRKKYKHSFKHLLISELGHSGTERIHLHGIIFLNINKDEIQNLWKYGFVYVGEYCNDKTISYITKYITKMDIDHKGYKPIILASKGIGSGYIKRGQFDKHKYNGSETKDYYIMNNGQIINNPIYYRNKLYNEDERENLWIQRLNKQERYVLGTKINVDTEKGYKEYEKLRNSWQKINSQLGYGDDTKLWSSQKYNITYKMINKSVKKTHTEKQQVT